MKIFDSVKDHFMIGGPNAIAGWGLLVLLVLSNGYTAGLPKEGVNLYILLSVLVAAALTGNGVYAINAYYDYEADKINKPNRPIPSGRMTPKHARKYSYILMGLGMLLSLGVSIWQRNYLMFLSWSVFTLLGFAYSMPPFKLKSRHILGNLCFGAFCALASFIGIILTPKGITLIDIISNSFIIIYIAGLITMKDFGDYEGDEQNGDMTLPVKVGRKKAAGISIVLILIPLIVWFIMWPPTSLLKWIMNNWASLLVIGSFAVYIMIDAVDKKHFISSAYSRVIYFYVILYVAYGFLKSSLLPVNPVTALVLAWDPYIALSVYIAISTTIVHRSWKVGHDILKPK